MGNGQKPSGDWGAPGAPPALESCHAANHSAPFMGWIYEHVGKPWFFRHEAEEAHRLSQTGRLTGRVILIP